MNLLVAFILLMIVAWIGMPQIIKGQFSVASDSRDVRRDVLVSYVAKDSPAAKAGIQERDKLLSITSANGQKQAITAADSLPSVTHALAGQEVTVQYVHNGETKSAKTQLLSTQAVEQSKGTDQPKGYLGVSPSEYVLKRATWSAPIVAAGLIKQFTVATFQGIGTAINALIHGEGKKASEQVSGPVGIVVVLKDGSLLGIQFVLMIIAIISLTLAIMNVLPIPALDGGRLFVTIIAHLRGKPISQETEERIYGYGFMALMLLVVTITVVDVKRFF